MEQFVFNSVGKNGTITKFILYTPTGEKENQYNLGFRNIGFGGLNDEAVSNNGDLLTVLNTIAKTIYDFTEKYPERTVIIKPVDSRRAKLYHSIFERKANEIRENFILKGFDGQLWENFNSERHYIRFELFRR